MSKGILDTISGLFGGAKEKVEDAAQGGLGDLMNSGVGKEVVSLLDKVKSFDPQQIETVLSALSKSTDSKVQDAKSDLQTVKHDGTEFVEKLKGYAKSLPQLLQTLLPTLQSILKK